MNLIGVKEFNQSFFDKIDQIEVDISNEVQFDTIVSNLNIKPIKINNFKFSSEKNDIEKKIFELRNISFDLFDNGDDYILYKITKAEERKPNLNDPQIKKEILELVYQKNKYEYNKELLSKIDQKKFNKEEFLKMGQNKIETLKLNSIKDNKKFDINAVEILYAIPTNSFTLVNDEKNNIYLAKVKGFQNEPFKNDDNQLKEYSDKLNSGDKNRMLKSYDLYLNKKYKVTLNQKIIERVKNFFQ